MTRRHYIPAVLLALLLILPGAQFAQASDQGGWGEQDAYNKHYDVNEMDNFKCVVKEIKEEAPMKGMAPGFILVVDMDDEDIVAHVGPVSFVKKLGFRKGDKLKIRGAWAEIDGKEVFMVSKIKGPDDYSLKVRLTKDGKPFWAMSREELQKELEAMKAETD